jgi:hypothetical protein
MINYIYIYIKYKFILYFKLFKIFHIKDEIFFLSSKIFTNYPPPKDIDVGPTDDAKEYILDFANRPSSPIEIISYPIIYSNKWV